MNHMVEVQITKVYGDGKTTIPLEIRQRLGISDGDRVLWYINEKGEVCIKKVAERRFKEPWG